MRPGRYTGPQAVARASSSWLRLDTMPKDAARTVLVLEDDASVQRPLVKFLELHGFAVASVNTVDTALDVLRKQPIVAAVVDLRLQHGSGRDVVAAVPGNIPVIIFSGVPSESGGLERFRPRTRLIEKPFSLVQLVAVLEEMVAKAATDSKNLQA